MVDAGNKAAEAAMRKRNVKKKPSDSKQIALVVFGVGSVAILALAVWPEGTGKAAVNTGINANLVNDANLVSSINSQASWSAKEMPFFGEMTLGQISAKSVWVKRDEDMSMCPTQGDVPSSFDARETWSKCIPPVRKTDASCSDSYAAAYTDALAARFCIEDPPEYAGLQLSMQEMVSCGNAEFDIRGCRGADMVKSIDFLTQKGVRGDSCLPYNKEAKCGDKCTDEDPMKALTACRLINAEGIQRELMRSGPLVGVVSLKDDLLLYSEGVYAPTYAANQLHFRREPSMQAVLILGWGEENGEPYWLVQNSWGTEWGEQGLAKIIRTVKENASPLKENFVVSLIPNNRKFKRVVGKTRQDEKKEETPAEDDDDDLDDDDSDDVEDVDVPKEDDDNLDDDDEDDEDVKEEL